MKNASDVARRGLYILFDLHSSKTTRLAEGLVAKAAFIVVFVAVFAITEFLVSEHLFAAGLTVFERLVVELFAVTVAEVLAAFTAVETAAVFAACARAGSGSGAGRRLVGHQAESRFVTANGHVGQNVEDFLRHGFGEFYGAELVEQLDASDVGTADVAFAGDSAYDVSRRHVVAAADSQVVAQVAFFDTVCTFVAFLAEAALFFAVEAKVVVAAIAAFTSFARNVKRLEFWEERLLFLPNLDDGGGDVDGG